MFNNKQTSFGVSPVGSIFGQSATSQPNQPFSQATTNQQPTQTFGSFGGQAAFGNPLNTSFNAGNQAANSTPTFGQQPGTATTGLFGQSTPGFNNASPSTSTSIFGTQTQPGQQTTTGGLFGQTPTLGGSSLFQNQTSTPSFSLGGQAGAQASPFGQQASSPFGVQQPGVTTPFSTQARPAGTISGTTGPFGSTGTSIFGAQASSNLFNTTNTFGQTASPFGAAGQQQQQIPIGTASIRFEPPTGQDSISKNGVPTNVQTRHQNITAMKQYEMKSVDELRAEDYAAGRKPGQAAPATNALGGLYNKTGASLFGQTGTGSTTGTSAFGTANQTFGAFGTGTTAASSPFGQVNSTFTSTPSAFGQPSTQTQPPATGSTSLFGQQNQSSPFGSAANTTTSLFGQPQQQQQSSNTGSLFGANNAGTSTTNVGLGGSLFQNQTPFSLNTSATAGATPFGSNPSATAIGSTVTTGNSLFGSSPFGSGSTTTGQTQQAAPFGQPTTPFGFGAQAQQQQKNTLASSPFGQTSNNTANTTQNTNIFGQPQQQQNSLFGNTFSSASNTTGPFGTNSPGNTNNTLGGLSFNLQNQQQQQNKFSLTNFPSSASTDAGKNGFSNLFGQQQQQRSLGQLTSNLGGQFGQNSNLTGFNQTFQTPIKSLSGIFPSQQQNLQQPIQSQGLGSDLLMNRLKTLPYGDTSLSVNTSLNSISNLNSFTTDPKNLTQYRLSAKAPKSSSASDRGSQSTQPIATRPSAILFDGLDDSVNDDVKCALDVFVAKRNIKKLVLKPKIRSPQKSTPPHTTSNSSHQVQTKSPSNDHQTHMSQSPASSFSISRMQENSATSEQENLNGLDDSRNGDHQVTSVGDSSKNIVQVCTLSSADYYTEPSIEEMAEFYNPNTGKCMIENFTIGRDHYGHITYRVPVDVMGLNFDEIVHIRRKEVVVYPDDERKPPVGEGLNCPAQVTLHQVWPIDKTTRETIKDPERLSLMKYKQRIESATIKKGAKFVDYKPQTGTWIFDVEHFSKYGLTDEDEEPPAPSTANSTSGTGNSDNTHVNFQNITKPRGAVAANKRFILQQQQQQQHQEGESCENDQDQQLIADIARSPEVALALAPMFASDAAAASADKLQDKFQERDVMRNVLFDDDCGHFDDFCHLSHDYSNDRGHNISGSPVSSSRLVLKNQSQNIRALAVHGTTKRIALLGQNRSEKTITPYMASYESLMSVPKQPKIRLLAGMLRPDLYAAHNKMCRDIGSIKFSGSPRVRFMHGSRQLLFISIDSISICQLKLIPDLIDVKKSSSDNSFNGNIDKNEICKKFESYLEKNSTITQLDHMRPTLAPYIETNDYIDEAESRNLLHALYGELTTSAANIRQKRSKKASAYAKQNERLIRVLKWLSSKNRRLPVPNNLYQRVIYHLACDRHDLAAQTAMNGQHPRLALLVASANISKDLMIEQLEIWRVSGADQFIDLELLKIYVLLSGLTEWKLSNGETVNWLKSLEWTQQLSLLILHVPPMMTSPENSENLHGPKYGFYMLPLFIHRLDTQTNDVDYHILAVHNPTIILSAAPSLLEEWFLLESLKSYHVMTTEHEFANSDLIHCNVVSQLAYQDLRWACFVALHIVNHEVRNFILTRCLEQNAHQLISQPQVEQWLLEKLKIPIEFIIKAKSLYLN